MIEGRNVLAVVPARGGSKGVPLKNIQPILGVPLVARVGQVIKEVPVIDRAVVSTDHAEIARIAVESGIDAPFFRPAEISGDAIGDWDVLVHALEETERLDRKTYDIVVMLQPTSPMRKPEHVTAAVRMLVEQDYDAVWTVSESDPKYHPLKQLTMRGDMLGYYDSRGASIVARQQLEPLYHRNGAAYAFTRECLVDQRGIMGKRTGPLVIEGFMISIDTWWDFKIVEMLLAGRPAASEAGVVKTCAD